MYSISYQCLTLYLIETPSSTSANRADHGQAVLIRSASLGSTLFAYEKMIRYDPALVDVTSKLFVLCTDVAAYLYNYL